MRKKDRIIKREKLIEDNFRNLYDIMSSSMDLDEFIISSLEGMMRISAIHS